MHELYLGMISGTSVDGVDAVIAEFGDRRCRLIAARTFAYPRGIADRVRALIETPTAPLSEIGALDVAVGRFFADCGAALTREVGLTAREITAIGHHGQTVYHKPEEPEPFTMQLGDPSSVAAITQVATVADFRAGDIALGGQGAPLVPAFHEWLFGGTDRPRIILNLGGIANITVLAPGVATTGFDTGPSNALLDAWVGDHLGTPYDDGGRWAESGQSSPELLDSMLSEPYFSLPPPKSTGRELFNMAWLARHVSKLREPLPDADVQATLTELTAATISSAVTNLKLGEFEIFVCGGGAHNDHLIRRLGERLHTKVETTTDLGLDPDWVEATAFAWLARARLRKEPGNVPTVTGARKEAVLGALYCPSET